MRDDSYYHQDDPTEQIPYPSNSQQDQQGKLIIGGFQDNQNQRWPERRPYQNPSSPSSNPQQSYRPPQAQPFRQQVPPGGNAGYPQQPYYPQQNNQQANQGGAGTPVVERESPPYPVFPQSPQRKGRPKRKRKGCLIGCLVVLLLICIVGAFTSVTAQRVLAFGSAISTQAPLSTQTGYMGTSDRVNLLVMGYGGTGHDGAYLTDSMVVMSLLPQSHHTTLISVPRDLWVQIPAGSGQYHKLNYAYVDGSNNGANPVGGGTEAAQKISLITGLNVKYWLTINFTGFRDFINSIGGIDVYVPDSFTANYPKNDDPSINAGWKKIHFSKGMQHMDGETAIEYARARYVLDNPAEGSDFARSARQQIMIKAALTKVKSMSTWPSMYNALSALEHTIYTNLSLADLAQFALKMDLNNAHRVGLSNQNVLVDATAPDGEYILQPANGNWQGIIDYVKQQLYN
ncbi:MAG TPA: LCP family protein [Ktedonobacteraceae bacterium]|nr:LCP family protein [Ktedonobacteraceae bacterium]